MTQQAMTIRAAIITEMDSEGGFSVDDISQSLWDNNGLEISPESVMRAINSLRKSGDEIANMNRKGWYQFVRTSSGVSVSEIAAHM